MALEPLPLFYMDPVPILNTFAQKYRTEAIFFIILQAQSRTVEDAIWSIDQVLSTMGYIYLLLNSQG